MLLLVRWTYSFNKFNSNRQKSKQSSKYSLYASKSFGLHSGHRSIPTWFWWSSDSWQGITVSMSIGSWKWISSNLPIICCHCPHFKDSPSCVGMVPSLNFRRFTHQYGVLIVTNNVTSQVKSVVDVLFIFHTLYFLFLCLQCCWLGSSNGSVLGVCLFWTADRRLQQSRDLQNTPPRLS